MLERYVAHQMCRWVELRWLTCGRESKRKVLRPVAVSAFPFAVLSCRVEAPDDAIRTNHRLTIKAPILIGPSKALHVP